MSDQIIRDTTAPANMLLDSGYQGVLAYRDGRYRWPAQQVARYLKAGKLVYPITVTGASPHTAQVADCERYDLSPAGAAAWARERNALHHDATIYTSRAGVPAVVQALGAEPCWLWVADWTGVLHVPALQLPHWVRLAAVQYATGDLYDTSAIVSAAWPAAPWKGNDW